MHDHVVDLTFIIYINLTHRQSKASGSSLLSSCPWMTLSFTFILEKLSSNSSRNAQAALFT
jgi:hypothetical protein